MQNVHYANAILGVKTLFRMKVLDEKDGNYFFLLIRNKSYNHAINVIQETLTEM